MPSDIFCQFFCLWTGYATITMPFFVCRDGFELSEKKIGIILFFVIRCSFFAIVWDIIHDKLLG